MKRRKPFKSDWKIRKSLTITVPKIGCPRLIQLHWARWHFVYGELYCRWERLQSQCKHIKAVISEWSVIIRLIFLIFHEFGTGCPSANSTPSKHSTTSSIRILDQTEENIKTNEINTFFWQSNQPFEHKFIVIFKNFLFLWTHLMN